MKKQRGNTETRYAEEQRTRRHQDKLEKRLTRYELRRALRAHERRRKHPKQDEGEVSGDEDRAQVRVL